MIFIKIYLLIGLCFAIYNAYALYQDYYNPEKAAESLSEEDQQELEEFLDYCDMHGPDKVIIPASLELILFYPVILYEFYVLRR